MKTNMDNNINKKGNNDKKSLKNNVNNTTKKNTKRKNKVGGMALFNGLLIRNREREVVTNLYGDEIKIQIKDLNGCVDNKNGKTKFNILNLPMIRGINNIFKTVISSTPYVISSAKKIVEDIVNGDDEDDIEINNFMLTAGYLIATTIIFSMFILIPNLVSLFFTDSIKNLVQVIIQIAMFSGYLIMLSRVKMLKSLFEYHGAEHKVINAYEDLEQDEITVENVKKHSRFHKRCGGNFVMYLFITIGIITLAIPSEGLLVKSIIQIVTIPLVIGFAYEFLMLCAMLPKFLSFICYPAMVIQFVTTKEPSDDKIKLAIYSLFGCVNEDNTLTVKKYLAKYKKDNLILNSSENVAKEIEFNLDDMLRVVSFVTSIEKNKLFLNIDTEILSYEDQIKLDTFFYKIYKENIPLQYILGKQSFYKEEYIVTNDVLIPRADSEILVEKAIEYINKYELKTLIDLCSGSGCLGISIANNSDIEKVFLTDISIKAMNVARRNISLNNADDKVLGLISNLLEVYLKNDCKYDIIVSNPPYIPTKDIENLSSVVKNEPHLALDGGKTGLDFYIKILEESKKVLREDGILIFEIGYDQLEKITKLIKKHKEYELLESVKDLGGNDRVIVCRFLRR